MREVGTRGQIGASNPNWHGGERTDERGYRRVRVNGKYVREHRLVAEKMLGRALRRREVVHHIDGNTLNNDPSNLQVFDSNGQHTAHHRAEKRKRVSTV
jgi:hypothetical protein